MNAASLDFDKLSDGVCRSNGVMSDGKVVDFPQGARTQDVIISLALRGEMPADIAELLRIDEVQVDKVLQSEWAAKELERVASERPESSDTVRNLIRIHSYNAVMTVASIAQDKKVAASVRLTACKTLLEYSLAPAKMLDVSGRKNEDMSPESMAKESAELEKKKQRLEEQLKKAI